jgi:SAM-dependent methyltransferase
VKRRAEKTLYLLVTTFMFRCLIERTADGLFNERALLQNQRELEASHHLIRESGMPEEQVWKDFFCPEELIELLLKGENYFDVAEFGSGYGTFTLPLARRVHGTVTAIDLDSHLVDLVQRRAVQEDLRVQAILRDLVQNGSGLPSSSQSAVLLFNILHHEDPNSLLREAKRILRPGGLVAVLHWRSDLPTPRGPPLSIRPTPQDCVEWLETSGFEEIKPLNIEEICPFHFLVIAHVR